MTKNPGITRRLRLVLIAIRWLLGCTFIYMGMVKALHPVDFLKVLHQYDFARNIFLLNTIAALLPWFEVFCGVLLLAGIATPATSLVVLAMLIPFTAAVLQRALAIQHAGHIFFCAIRFDCGCGGGEVNVCRKLFENSLLIVLASMLLFFSRSAIRSRK